MAIELPTDFKDFLRLLNAHHVEYLVIGGYAVGYHGYPRATQDIDIWIAINPENAEKTVKAIREFGFDLPELTPEVLFQENRILRFGYPPIRIEVFTSASGVKFDECYQSRVIENVEGLEISLLSMKDLITNKKASGRLKDLADLEALGEL